MKRNTIFAICLLMLLEIVILIVCFSSISYKNPADEFNNKLFIIAFVVFTVINILYIYYNIIKPIKLLNIEIDNISEGSGTTHFTLNGNVEIEKLAKSLNYFVKNMENSIEMEMNYINKMSLYTEKLEHAYDIIEKSSIVVLEWSQDPIVPAVYVTDNISIFGYTPEDFYSGRIKFADFVYIEDREKTLATVKNARENSITEFKHDYRVNCKDGSIRWVEEWTFIERDDSGEIIAEKGILNDITSQVVMAEKLRQSEERFRGLYENASAIIFTYDERGNFTSANKAAIKASGYTLEELLRMKVSELIIDEKSMIVSKEDIIKYTEEHPDKILEVTIKSKQEEIIILECMNSIVYKNGQPYELQTIAQNITERKAAENKIYHLSYHDKLTGVYNRAYYDQYLKDLETDRQYPISLVIGDMNSLKLANDAFGHKEGDRLLKMMAGIILNATGKAGIVARIGGDEFAVVLPKTKKEEATKLCNRIRELCEAANNGTIKPSIALGYATKLSDEDKIDDLIREADENMYKNKLNESRSSRSSIISSLQATLEEKTMETKEHAERLRENSLKLGKALCFSDSMMDELSIASIMHDIGKIAIADDILLKPGKLDEREWEIMQKHTEIGYHIILSSPNMASIAEYILAHHERWDGFGYPRGLKGEEIPIISRVISIADSFDVITNDRPYSKAISKEEAFEELRRCSGTQFDPDLIEKFIEIVC